MEMIAAAIVISLIGVLVKSTGGQVSPIYALWFRCLIHLLILAPAVYRFGFSLKKPKIAAFRALSGFIGMGLYFLSLQQMPLAVATSIFWSAPLFTLILSHVLTRTPMPKKDQLSFALVVLGMGVLAGSFHSVAILPFVLCLVSSAAIGASYYYLGELTRAQESPLSVTFSFSFTMFLLGTPFTFMGPAPALQLPVLSALILMGVLAIAYQFLITRAYAKYDTQKAAMIQAILIPIANIALDVFAFHRHLNAMVGLGLTLLIIAQALRMKFTRKTALRRMELVTD